MTPGQLQAREEILTISMQALDVLELVGDWQLDDSRWWVFEISLPCRYDRKPGGLPLRARECFLLLIAPDYPFRKPNVAVRHDRFAGFPHVQWKHSLCLYQSPETEWDPRRGIVGLLDRLDLWLHAGARNEFEAEGAALHPPVAYTDRSLGYTLVMRQDTPSVPQPAWLGLARIDRVSNARTDVISWSVVEECDEGPVAAAVLLAEPMPFEFPSVLGELLKDLASRGVQWNQLLLLLQRATRLNEEGLGLHVVIGTPMRGIQGQQPKQHLLAWYLEPLVADGLRLTGIVQASLGSAIQESVQRVIDAVQDWAQGAPIQWCSVMESRPEVTARRDHSSPLAWFRDKRVELWGCGALGGPVAHCLARAGVAQLTLRDKGTVSPGLLTRQVFADADIGLPKVGALAKQLRCIRPDLDLDCHTTNILTLIDNLGPFDNIDIVIDATASRAVAQKLEWRIAHGLQLGIPIAAMVIDHRAERGLSVVAFPTGGGGIVEVLRSTKLALCHDDRLAHFYSAFWPKQPPAPFQPEVGCSSATFVGSSADVNGLSSMMLNCIASELPQPPANADRAHLIVSPHVAVSSHGKFVERLTFPHGIELFDPETEYVVRLTRQALLTMRGEISAASHAFGPAVETGGYLFGEYDNAARIVWVSEVVNAPADSERSSEGFNCGIEGIQDLHDNRRAATLGSVGYVGTWHTHPHGSPYPSGTDLQAAAALVSQGLSTTKQLVLILGENLSHPSACALVFDRRHIEQWTKFLEHRTWRFRRKLASTKFQWPDEAR